MFRRLFSHLVAIDLGTASTLIHTAGGIVINQASVVSFRKEARGEIRMAAVGSEARRLLGREPQNMQVVRPVRHGVIADFSAAEQMIRRFVDMAGARSLLARHADFTVCIPSGSTQVEQRSIREAALAGGAGRICLVRESLAAAMGANLPVLSSTGSMVVDIGAGTTEVGVIALGGVVAGASIRLGGDQFDTAIVAYVRNHYGVLLGELTAELVKQTIGSADRDVPYVGMNVTGRNTVDGMPRAIELGNHEISDAMEPPLLEVIAAIRTVLEDTPAELMTDMCEHGIVLTGGGALLKNLCRRLRNELGLPVRVADEPLTCAVRGAAEVAGSGGRYEMVAA